MNTIYGLFLLLGSTVALAQGASSSPDIGNPASFETKGACLMNCDHVFADCKAQCENTSARAHERHYETPDLPVAGCTDDCQETLRFCKEDC